MYLALPNKILVNTLFYCTTFCHFCTICIINQILHLHFIQFHIQFSKYFHKKVFRKGITSYGQVHSRTFILHKKGTVLLRYSSLQIFSYLIFFYALLLTVPAQSNHMYFLFSCTQHLLRLFLHCRIQRNYVLKVPSECRHLPDTLA